MAGFVSADLPDLGPLWLSIRLAGVTTLALIVLGTPLAWWLARTHSAARTVLEAVVALPIVLPPTVLGFYLLLLLGPQGTIGQYWVRLTGDTLTFTFGGLVVASVIYSLPFVVQPLQNAFVAVGRDPLEAASTLGARGIDAFFTVAVPLAARGFLTAAVMGFAHTLGEFGVVLMVGGNIPGATRVVSIAIYDQVESLNYAQAHVMAAILLAFSFATLLALYFFNRPGRRG